MFLSLHSWNVQISAHFCLFVTTYSNANVTSEQLFISLFFYGLGRGFTQQDDDLKEEVQKRFSARLVPAPCTQPSHLKKITFSNYIKVCRKTNTFSYLLTNTPHFNGHGIGVMPQVVSLWSCSSFFLIFSLHSQVVSLNGHAWEWATFSPCFKVAWHNSQVTIICWHFQTWSLDISRSNFSKQLLHCPLKVESTLLANMLQKKSTPGSLHFAQAIAPVVFLNCSTQKPQKVWPQRAARCASRTGQLLQNKFVINE